MDTKHMQYHREQSGFVAILTVIFFAILMSVISIGFLRLMIQEQDQALQDDLSKSAYQSAQAGIEDAKRAILYCASKPTGLDRDRCHTQLYTAVCPGFNKQPVVGVSNYFKDNLGIPDAVIPAESDDSGGTQVGGLEARQGYSCVIVTRNSSSLKGELRPNTTGDATLLELRATEAYDKIRIKWHEFASDQTPEIPLAGEFTQGNPRYPEWRPTAPALLRAKTISLPYPGSFSIADASVGDLFLYPSLSGTDAASTTVPTAPLRIETRCITAPTVPPVATSDYGGYACAMDITFAGAAQAANRYLVLQALYRTAHYEVTAYNGTTRVDFDGIQPTIDATGFTNDVYRRVKVGVRLGAESLATNAALDTGLGFCKNFLVGGSSAVFDNECDN